MIDDDLAYSEGEEDHMRRKDPAAFGKWQEERKRIRQREKTLDDLDVQLEEQERRELQELKL